MTNIQHGDWVLTTDGIEWYVQDVTYWRGRGETVTNVHVSGAPPCQTPFQIYRLEDVTHVLRDGLYQYLPIPGE